MGFAGKFYQNKLNIAALVIVAFAFLVAFFGYLIAPDNTPYANRQFIEIGAQSPGFRANMLKMRKNEPFTSSSTFKTLLHGKKSPWHLIPFNAMHFEGADVVIHEFDPYPGNIPVERRISLPDVVYPLKNDAIPIIVGEDSVQCILVDGSKVITSLEDLKNEVIKKHQTRFLFLLGTDRNGRDVLSQLILGTRVSLSVGLFTVIISLIFGTVLGSIAGYFQGRTDDVIMWFITVVWSIPSLLLVLAISFSLGKGYWQVFIAIGLTTWVDVARVVRGQMMQLKEKEFVEAARALGFSNGRIIFRHILPNITGSILVIGASNFASAILIEAGLSFLGFGVQPPMPSWGAMIRENYSYLILGKAHLALLPGFCIMAMVLSLMVIGNGLRDALDVRNVDGYSS